MQAIVQQEGYCLVCGNPVHSDHDFFESEKGYCHSNCL